MGKKEIKVKYFFIRPSRFCYGQTSPLLLREDRLLLEIDSLSKNFIWDLWQNEKNFCLDNTMWYNLSRKIFTPQIFFTSSAKEGYPWTVRSSILFGRNCKRPRSRCLNSWEHLSRRFRVLNRVGGKFRCTSSVRCFFCKPSREEGAKNPISAGIFGAVLFQPAKPVPPGNSMWGTSAGLSTVRYVRGRLKKAGAKK
jgi:hypothetical protein